MNLLRRVALCLVLAGTSMTVVSCTSDSSSTATTVSPVTTQAAKDCAVAREVAAVLAESDLTDPDGIRALPTSLRDLQNVVAPDLAPDVDTLANAIDDFVALLEEYDFDLTAIDNDPSAQARLVAMNDPEVTAAAARLQEWIDTSCAGS